ncbi:6899_t:CDS:2, partial [Ambispora gerdemannii]
PKARRQRTTQHYIAPQKSPLIAEAITAKTTQLLVERVVPGSAINVNAKTLLSSYSNEFAELKQAAGLAKFNKSNNISVNQLDPVHRGHFHHPISKKEKLRDRHVKWLQKLDATYSDHSNYRNSKDNKKKRNLKNQTNQKDNNNEDPTTTLDLSSLKQILETLPDMKSDADKFVPGRNRAPLPKGLNGKKVVVIQNPVFMADPLSTIQAHIHNTLGLSDDKVESPDSNNKDQSTKMTE